MDWASVVKQLMAGLATVGAEPGRLAMMAVGGVLIYLAVAKEYEPVLLLPIGFACILTNIPLTGMGVGEEHGLFDILYKGGIINELFPLLIFVGVGAMTDFGPLLENPKMALLGAAGQFGIFGTLLLATLLGFDIKEAASIGMIGSADGPTSIYVAGKLAPHMLGPIAVAAYSYMSLVPVIQPPVMRLLTTKEQRRIKDAIHLTSRIQADAGAVSHRGHPDCGVAGAIVDAPYRYADVRQPAARGPRGGTPEQGGTE